MKIVKSQLKAIIKECLVEILAEGLGSNINEAVSAKPKGPRNRDAEPLPGQHVQRAPVYADPYAGRRKALDEVRMVPREAHVAPTSPPASINALTRDPVMAAIFADTARTTLVEQRENIMPGDAAAQTVARTDPSQIFNEEQIDRWNEAAFKTSRPSTYVAPLPADFLNDLLKS